MTETPFTTLKTDFNYRRVWPTKKAARIEVGKWIEDRYNRRRRHASIGQITPVAFDLQYARQIADSQSRITLSTKRDRARSPSDGQAREHCSRKMAQARHDPAHLRRRPHGLTAGGQARDNDLRDLLGRLRQRRRGEPVGHL